ncbi:hypothetical protein HWV62_4359 [Athelia sp. TMB]|nr:hypothetical protein HWV62_4359 [Athelia sp. TMB]
MSMPMASATGSSSVSQSQTGPLSAHRERSQPSSLSDVDHEPKHFLSPEATTVHSYNFSPRSSHRAILDYVTPPSALIPAAAPLHFTPLTAGAIERARTPTPQPTRSNYPTEKHQPRASAPLSWIGSTTSAPDPPVSLTDEQIDFVRGLGSANVPPEDIARVIARMKADYSDGRVAGSIPPGYE